MTYRRKGRQERGSTRAVLTRSAGRNVKRAAGGGEKMAKVVDEINGYHKTQGTKKFRL